MKKLLMLAFSNIRKTKASSAYLLMMFIIAGLLFNAGLLVLINFGGFFDKTAKELNASDTYYLISDNVYNEEVENFIYHHDNVLDIEKEANLWGLGYTVLDGEDAYNTYLINNISTKRELSKSKLIGESIPLKDNSIYLPVAYKINYDFKLHDEFIISFQNNEFKFFVAGFIEDIFFSSAETGPISIYVTDKAYQLLESTLGGEAKVTKLFVNLKEINKEVEIGIKQITKAETLTSSTDYANGMFGFDIEVIKTSRVIMATMISLIFVSFSALIVITCLLIVRFRINNTIEDDMTKIGTLKAVGYTSKQIISSIIIQFSIISLIGSVIGILLSYLAIPSLSNIFAAQSSLIWEQDFDSLVNSYTFIFINLFVIVISLLSSLKIRRLHPIIALRSGIRTHSFQKNYFPLKKSRLPLTSTLALKSIFNNLKQTIMILIISLTIAFAGSFAVIMFYNTNVDITTFKETPGEEISNVTAFMDPSKEDEEIKNLIKNHPDVRKLQYIDTTTGFIDGIEVLLFVMEDYNAKETNTIYEGRYPLHHNEIAINGYMAEILSKNIGEELEIESENNKQNYLITGFTQGSSMLGMNGAITVEGIKKINPNFKQLTLEIYLKDGVDTEAFVAEMETLYHDRKVDFMDMDKAMEQGVESYASLVSMLGIVILIFTSLIIILVLYLVINSSIVRNKKQIGIQKSIGFTTIQLMMQFSLLFVSPVIIGSLLGGTLGIFITNPMLSVVQKSMGIMKANYIIKPTWIYIYTILIIIISYITSLLVTYRIRKISAYSLIIE